eukprot:6191039-Pleurochrysis_carterae.AAC.2
MVSRLNVSGGFSDTGLGVGGDVRRRGGDGRWDCTDGLSGAQRARPALSVEKATSPPPPLKRELSALSFSSGDEDSAEATSAAFATAAGGRPSRACLLLTRRGQSLCQCWPWHQRHFDHLTDHDSPAAGRGRFGSLERAASSCELRERKARCEESDSRLRWTSRASTSPRT